MGVTGANPARIGGSDGRGGSGERVPWVDVLLASIAAVSWALVGMAGAAALGLHLLGADSAGSLGPMTAAVVVLAVGGSVTPTGDVSAFGLEGAQARTAVEITPLGVGLVGALLLAYFFLRSLRRAEPYISGGELAARAGGVVVSVRRDGRRVGVGRSRRHHDRRSGAGS